ncbi:uncharacterized protein LOC131641227 [Vicia villosa]|uniref:uncharacterized protein LOC131641227 n=1 Tax=Vicia villosa TaxID=3911 RepID=UPI00273AC921|nr:uncharacterized protein LOC131641227 [Vicia villosa]
MLVEDPILGNWRLTGFYGFPESSRRRDSWNLIRNLADSSNLPWCIIGDFNDILFSNEKKGRIERPNWMMSGFRHAIQDAGLIDIPLEGYCFTWFKSLGTPRAVEEKLDRAMMNSEWSNSFPGAKLECLTAASSDHFLVLLTCIPTVQHSSTRTFKFENAWLTEPGFTEFVRDNWNYSTVRKKVNAIKSLVNENGDVIESTEGMCQVASAYFNDLFQKKASSRDRVLQAIDTLISEEDNDMLTAGFSLNEFRDAIFSMQADKSPGPDGFNPGFYHHFWDTCGTNIFQAVCGWLETGSVPQSLNKTNITFIPKGDTQTTMKDWRPIALCNVLYKVIAKVLANRLKKILGKCISDNQSAFVPERSILDNVMAAIEVIHHMKTKTRGRVGEIALKLDISKAYDRIDWDYLKDILITMGFCQKWVGWIMLCVSTVEYSVNVNGNMIGPIVPGRGLRQGDPLSPYLFILCAEGLTALIRKAQNRGDIHGVKICRNASIISHLLIADDCFLFFRANTAETNVMKDILATYEEASGQAINFQKSEVYCSRIVNSDTRQELATCLGVQQVLGTGNYLGIPSMIGRSRKSALRFIKDRIWRKINSWSSRSLSQAGRETMIKSVLQSIPTYIMSLFLIPSSLIDEIEKMMNSFWWGHKRDRAKGIHWLSWDRLSMPKVDGGMGFKNLNAFNLAMLSKQAWRLTTNTDSLVSRLYKARYFPNSDYLSSNIGHNPSYVWRSIWSSKFVIKGGLKWSIRSGENISVWDHYWLADGSSLSNPWPNNMVVDNLKVSDLMTHNGKDWNHGLINALVGEESAHKIQNTPLFTAVHKDKLLWKHESNGKLSVRSAYRYCINDAIDTSHLRIKESWNLLWNIKAPPRVKNFMWRLCRDCVPTRRRLLDKGVNCVTPVSNQDQKAIFSVTLWSIWKGRNNQVWNQVEDSPTLICQRANQLLTDWKEAKKYRLNNEIINSLPAIIRWEKPQRGRFKCNIDAAFSHNKVGFGACIRDELGNFIVARTEWFSPCTDVVIGEALGLLKAVNWVHDMGYDNMDFELDAKRVVDSVTSPRPNDSDLGAITGECNRLMALFFRNSHVKFVRRQANEVAHALARVILIGENVDGKSEVVSPLVKHKEFTCKTLKKEINHISTSISDLVGGVYDPHENIKATQEPEATFNPPTINLNTESSHIDVTLNNVLRNHVLQASQ